MAQEPPKRRPSVSQLSKTPSWVMLGFILGALFVLALPRREPSSPRPMVLALEPEKKSRASEPPLVTTIEAVFDEWASYAAWDNDVTQVAMWNAAVGEFAEFYEVRRVAGIYYFRSLPRLTNRPVRHGKQPPPECPLRFTETEEQYREWREQGRVERPAEDVRPRPALRVPRAPVSTPLPTPSPSMAPIVPPAAPSIENADMMPKK